MTLYVLERLERFLVTLEQWLDPWKYKSTDVQQRVKLALEFLERHYGAAREEKILREIKCID